MTDAPEPDGTAAEGKTPAPSKAAEPGKVEVPREPRGEGAAPGPAPAGLGSPTFGPLVPLVAIVLVLVGALALREVATILVPVVFGLFLALVAWPMVGILERRGARHGIALTAALMVVLAIVLVAGGILALSAAELVLQVPKYEGRLRDQIAMLQDLLGQFGVTTDPGALLALIKPDQVLSVVRPLASALSGAGLTIFVLTFTMIYALFGASSLQARAQQTFGERHSLILGIEQFGVDLRRYLLVRAQLGIFAAVLAFLLLFVLGVPFPALWAFLVFAASFIPNIGTFIAVIPPTIMAFLSGGIVPAVAVIVGYTLINFAQDHFLQPVMMGSELNLSPLVVFISVLAWAWILGAAGALLAVPLTVGLVAIMEAYPASRDVAALLRNTIEPPPGSTPDQDAFTAPSD